MKRHIAEITGVVPVISDMCRNSCIAFTGPLAMLDTCSECGEPRLDPITKKAPQHLYTIPIGPQLQAQWRDIEGAQRILYRRRKTREIITQLEGNNPDGGLPPLTDFLHSNEYLEAVRCGHINDNDMVLMLSMDGAQLYEHKASDCWIYIWILFDLAPDLRYKKKYVLPGGFIPGKLKIVDSFLFPGLYHLSALQREGIQIWDALEDEIISSKPFFALGTADGPGMTYLNGLVGHHGKHGCHLYCPITGRHKHITIQLSSNQITMKLKALIMVTYLSQTFHLALRQYILKTFVISCLLQMRHNIRNVVLKLGSLSLAFFLDYTLIRGLVFQIVLVWI